MIRNSTSKGVLITILLVVCLPVIYVILFTGYIQVIVTPQHAQLIMQPDVSLDGIYINGVNVELPHDTWKARNRFRPVGFFGGLNWLMLDNEESGDVTMHIDFDLSKGIPVGVEVPLKEAEFISKLRIWDNTSYLGIARDERYYCGFDNSLVKGTVLVYEFSQKDKRFILDGMINVDPSDFAIDFKCDKGEFSKEGLANVEINSLRFSIDSPIIYEWSNKGGKAWRL